MPAIATVTPDEVVEELYPGEYMVVEKTVDVPETCDSIDVWAEVSDVCSLYVTFDPTVHEDVVGPTSVNFMETIQICCQMCCYTECDIVLGTVVKFWAGDYSPECNSTKDELLGEQVITITVPCGDEGLTPGYWKNNAAKWDAVSWIHECYSPDALFSNVFGVIIEVKNGGKSTIKDPTLLQALNANGGGVNTLARHALAALLNAAHPDINYPVGAQCVTYWTKNALLSGNPAEIEALKNKFEDWNELGGGIDMHDNPI